MKTMLLVNANAGKQGILREIGPVREVFAAGGGDVEVVETASKEQGEQAVRLAMEKRPERLVVCGGDGTLSDTVDLLRREGALRPLGYIPAGTTNDFATFLGIPKEPVKAASFIAMGKPRALDLGQMNGRSFLYVASFGAFTQSSYNTTQSLKNSLGHLAYVIEGIKELPALQAYEARVETAEGGVYEGEYLYGGVSNSTSLGGVIKLDPEKVGPQDGLFELSLVKRPKSLRELNRILLALMSGKPDEELITFTHTRGAVFTCKEPMPWSLDGEYCAGGERVEAQVCPGAWELFW